MAALWTELLGVEPIGIHDDFFDLGGNSLLAVKLATEWEIRFGTQLSLAQMVEWPMTIDKLLGRATLDDQHTPHVLTFNRRGRRPPVVFFPDIAGSLEAFRHFPELFGPEQPVYVAQGVGADASDRISEPTIENIAAVYERELVDVLPRGPVVVGGFSFGASVAFEVARRLRARAFSVPLLVSLDGYAPGYPEFIPVGQRVRMHLLRFALSSADERRLYLSDRYDRVRARLWHWLGQEHRLCAEGSTMTPEMRRRVARLWRLNHQASRRYRPPPVDEITMLLIRAEHAPRWVGISPSDQFHGWTSFVRGRISVVTVPGNHASLPQHGNQPLIVDAIRQHLPAGWNDGHGLAPRELREA
jgi:thioesterase domain-containing protein